MIDFASNYNPMGPPPGIEDLVTENLPEIIGQYGDPRATLVDQAIAEYVNVQHANVANGVGSTEILFGLPRLLRQGRTIVLNPTFWEYAEASKQYGKKVDVSNLDAKNGFRPNLNELSEMLDELSAVVYICNPNNPTSSLIDSNTIKELADTYPDSEIVVDETYLHFREDFDGLTLSSVAAETENLHVAHSFSKFFAVPGIRSGALVSDIATIDRFKQMQVPYSISKLTQIVMPWLLDQKDFIVKSRNKSIERCIGAYGLLLDEFSDVMEVVEPQTNFIFARDRTAQSSRSVADYLKCRGIIVRRGDEFGPNFADYFRFCIRSDTDNEQLFSVLTDYYKTK